MYKPPPALCTKAKVAKMGGGRVFAGHYGIIKVLKLVSYSLSFLFPQILRLEIDGSRDPYCVGQWTSNPVGHIEVAPVHG